MSFNSSSTKSSSVLLEDIPIEELCRRLGTSRSAAYEAAELISKRLMAPVPKLAGSGTDHASCEQKLRERDFEIDMLRYQLDHPGSREAGVRIQFDPAYKAFVEDRRAHYGVTIARASQILMIPIDTMKKFHRFVGDEATPAGEEQGLPQFVIELVNDLFAQKR